MQNHLTLSIEVTPEDLAKNVDPALARRRDTSCPLSLGVARAFADRGMEGKAFTGFWDARFSDREGGVWTANLPLEAQAFIAQADQARWEMGGNPEPISFLATFVKTS